MLAAHGAPSGDLGQGIPGQVRPIRQGQKHRPDVGDDLSCDYGSGCGVVHDLT